MAHALVEWLFPAECIGCGVRAPGLCAACVARAPAAEPLAPPAVADCIALFAYEGVMREAVARIKYRNQRAVVDALAALLAERVRGRIPAGAVVTWPPTTRQRRRERGFDHAELLARAVAHRLGLRSIGLLRRLDGEAQTGRSATERRRGPSFAIGRGAALAVPAVLVVDDVTTTGATLHSAIAALRVHGYKSVIGVAVARTSLKPGAVRPDTQARDHAP